MFQNTVLQDFLTGITPYSEAGDYSDVSVRTTAGEILWSKLSRLSDEEMKTLIIDAVDPIYWLLQTLFDDVGAILSLQERQRSALLPQESAFSQKELAVT